MTAVATLPPDPAYGSPEWQAQRRQYIGASDVPAIMGCSPYTGRYGVWLQKRGLAEVGENAAMRWGHYHEPNVAREYQRAFPDVYLETVGTLPHPRFQWLRATVDRLVHRPDGTVHPLEIKSTSEYLGKRWGQPGTDEVPDYVLVQAQVQLMVLGLTWAHAAVLVGHSDCRLPYVIEQDLELQDMILDATHEFHQRYVIGGEEPEIDGPDAEAHLRRKFVGHTDVVRDLEGEEAALLLAYFSARAERIAAEEREDALKPQLLQLIAGDYGVRSAAGKALWASTKGRTTVDYKSLIDALKVPADIVQQYTRVGPPTRSLKCYPKEGATA